VHRQPNLFDTTRHDRQAPLEQVDIDIIVSSLYSDRNPTLVHSGFYTTHTSPIRIHNATIRALALLLDPSNTDSYDDTSGSRIARCPLHIASRRGCLCPQIDSSRSRVQPARGLSLAVSSPLHLDSTGKGGSTCHFVLSSSVSLGVALPQCDNTSSLSRFLTLTNPPL
jgi:hypothetical protein